MYAENAELVTFLEKLSSYEEYITLSIFKGLLDTFLILRQQYLNDIGVEQFRVLQHFRQFGVFVLANTYFLLQPTISNHVNTIL